VMIKMKKTLRRTGSVVSGYTGQSGMGMWGTSVRSYTPVVHIPYHTQFFTYKWSDTFGSTWLREIRRYFRKMSDYRSVSNYEVERR
jgi:hypothetical protein